MYSRGLIKQNSLGPFQYLFFVPFRSKYLRLFGEYCVYLMLSAFWLSMAFFMSCEIPKSLNQLNVVSSMRTLVTKRNRPFTLYAIFFYVPQERLLYHIDIAIKTSTQFTVMQSKMGGGINNCWLKCNSVKKRLSRPSWQILEALLLRMAGQTPMLSGKHSESFRSWERSHSWNYFLL